jgi:hypothetical protein
MLRCTEVLESFLKERISKFDTPKPSLELTSEKLDRKFGLALTKMGMKDIKGKLHKYIANVDFLIFGESDCESSLKVKRKLRNK